MFQNLGMQTPNHTVLSELLKSINATVELCKTKLPDQISDNCLACTGRNPALPVPSPNDSKQDLVDPICVDKAITSKNANYLRRKRRIVSLDTSESESEDEQQQKAPSPSSPAMRDPSLSSHAETHIDTSVTRAAGPQTTVQCPLDMQVVPEPFKSSPSKGKKDVCSVMTAIIIALYDRMVSVPACQMARNPRFGNVLHGNVLSVGERNQAM